jgi:hypothetical protein
MLAKTVNAFGIVLLPQKETICKDIMLYKIKLVQCSSWFLGGGGIKGAGGRGYWVWKGGEEWVFICLELQCDKVSCILRRRREGLNQTRRRSCSNDSLLAYCLKIPPIKNHACIVLCVFCFV